MGMTTDIYTYCLHFWPVLSIGRLAGGTCPEGQVALYVLRPGSFSNELEKDRMLRWISDRMADLQNTAV